jgi:hypothetical protein
LRIVTVSVTDWPMATAPAGLEEMAMEPARSTTTVLERLSPAAGEKVSFQSCSAK